ncbi:MAG: methionyl-tRNA formyltransferase [Gaiellaceae bacterium]
MTLAVAATAPFGAHVLEEIARTREIDLLLTRPDRPRGRGRRVQAPAAKEAAERLGIPVTQPERLTAEMEFTADVVVVAAYGVLIPDALLAERLWLNVHPSLLPRWRGAAPIERAIMAGDIHTGVTIHRTTAELDAGPIAAQESFAIAADDDAGVVYERAAPMAARLVEELLADDPTSIHFADQAREGVTYAEKIVSEDRELDWAAPAQQTIDRVRALAPHIGAWGTIDGRRLMVWRARLAQDAGANETFRVGDVELLEVQPEGRRRMSAEEYLRGRR